MNPFITPDAVVILTGLPGSGKSTWAREFAEKTTSLFYHLMI